jgi:phage baseplate assembly protein W
MENSFRDFKGTGWKFPIEFKRKNETVVMLTGEEDIRNSLDVLFATNVGERVMHTNYGSALSTFLFMPVNKSTMTYIQAIIGDEILFNEPRINVTDIAIHPSVTESGRLDITIEYIIVSTNNRYNYVYPFYIREATNLER